MSSESGGTQLLGATRGNSLKVRRGTIAVTAGPDAGKSVPLAGKPIRIGTGAGNDLVLTDPTVSRAHLEVEPSPLGPLLRDLDSTNGTFVDGNRVKEGWLRAGAQILAGQTKLAWNEDQAQEDIPLSAKDRFGNVLGRSPSMRAAFWLMEKVAPEDLTVLLTGETGTGKEAFAEALHQESPRKTKPFIVFDCGAVPENLMESELFGHMKGAFTGAAGDRKGAAEEADGGTLFLDEIGELPKELQPKLLRLLEKKEVKRVGSTNPKKVDVRIVAATNRDLASEVNRGAFREDLYYRLAVVQVKLPPLRERREDIPTLARHFAREFFTRKNDPNPVERLHEVPAEFFDQLSELYWPGNVRELRNHVERSLALGRQNAPTREADDKTGERPMARTTAAAADLKIDETRPFVEAKSEWVETFERAYLKALMERHAGNYSRAAREAALDRMYLKKLLRKYEML